MTIEIGMIVESEFGRGAVVALTNEWVVHQVDDEGRDEGREAALPKDRGEVWIPVTEYGENGSLHESVEL